MAEELRRLPGPYEILELGDRESRSLKIVGWERGTMEIHPRWPGAPERKEIPVLRVHVTEATKPYPPRYYDITSKTLQAQLLPLLSERGYEKWTYRVTAYGEAPRKRFTLERLPF
ncbi:MAG: hypothetical protein JRD89_03695 [Deltaproteobacteria bacterium]|nr:hypothetical protein [Deltaproteobacteria bacterium]